MPYFFYTCLYVFASVFYEISSLNYHGVSWYKDTSTTHDCMCNSFNKYFMNSSVLNKFVYIYPVTSNIPTNDCSQSKCIDCQWEIHVDYDHPLDVIYIGNAYSNFNLDDCNKLNNCPNYSLIITNCNGSTIFDYNTSNINNPKNIDVATQAKSICINFNSSQNGSVCNYEGALFVLKFWYRNVNDCRCQQDELYLNSINDTVYLPIIFSTVCLNVPCLKCKWHINISYADPNAFILINYGQDFQSCNSRLIMTNCKNNIPIIDSSSNEIKIHELKYGTDYEYNFVIQENELCITLDTTGSEVDRCSYYPTNGNFCNFLLKLQYYQSPEYTTKDLSMSTEIPILIVPDGFKCNRGGFSLTSNYDTLQLWIANNLPSNTSKTIYVFDSQNLSNIAAAYYDMDTVISQNSSTRSFSLGPAYWYSEKDWSQWFYYVFRIAETQFSSCDDTNFVNFAFPFEKTFILNAAANTSGNCLSSVLVPYVSPSACQSNLLSQPFPIMYISSISYIGPSSVKALSTIYNESYELFEFSEENAKYWTNFLIYGNLINFVIPPNGTLKMEYEVWLNEKNITEYDFEDYGLGIIQSSNYPNNASVQYMPRIIKCTKGLAKITIKLIYAEVPVGGQLQIYSQNQSKTYQQGIYDTNETIVFNSDAVYVNYFFKTNGPTSTGLLLHYEGHYININTPIWQKAWFWILCGIVILLLFVAVSLGCYCYHHRDKKEAERRFEFMIEIITKQNQLTPETVDELKEASDALFIPKEKLIIDYENPLGSGVCSSVYRGFLNGPSPLIKLTGLIETQDFKDCDVAVKVALHFGDDEVDQLFREIEAMKILQYDKNVISMLGWRMLNGKPALVFELAEQDLLRYAKMLMSIDVKEISFKTILSILWQIAKGMEFIASKFIVHRDLAARNVLLTNDFQAKISDFGLAVINNSGMKESQVLKKFPVRWLSIEAMVVKLFSEKSDVWAFGVLMYEVFSLGQDPYAGIPTGNILGFLRSGERMNRPRLATNEIYELMRSCWDENMESRPKFEELVPKLHSLLEDESGCSKYYEELETYEGLEFLQENEKRVSLHNNNSIVLEALDQGS